MLKRNPGATPVVDALTYYVDLMNWLLDGAAPVEVFARGQKGVLKAAGHDVDDVSYSGLDLATTAIVVNLGVSQVRCRAKYPVARPCSGSRGRSATDGVFILDDDHTGSSSFTAQNWRAARLPA